MHCLSRWRLTEAPPAVSLHVQSLTILDFSLKAQATFISMYNEEVHLAGIGIYSTEGRIF